MSLYLFLHLCLTALSVSLFLTASVSSNEHKNSDLFLQDEDYQVKMIFFSGSFTTYSQNLSTDLIQLLLQIIVAITMQSLVIPSLNQIRKYKHCNLLLAKESTQQKT